MRQKTGFQLMISISANADQVSLSDCMHCSLTQKLVHGFIWNFYQR